MKGSIVLLLIVGAMIGLFAFSSISQDSEVAQVTDETLDSSAKAGGMVQSQALNFKDKVMEMADNAEEESAQLAQNVQKKMDNAKVNVAVQQKKFAVEAEQVTEQAKVVTTSIKETAEDMATKIKSLLEKAQAYMESGDYSQASEMANNVLKFDPTSEEAKSILETAKQKIAALATEKAEQFKTGLGDKAGEVEAALGNIGQ